jgi:hypothetical protein
MSDYAIARPVNVTKELVKELVGSIVDDEFTGVVRIEVIMNQGGVRAIKRSIEEQL